MNLESKKNKVPTMLSHKPIVAIEDYYKIDGQFSNETDARCLSVGHAQYDDSHPKEISAKVFRHTGKQWSPQSEELPLHRCVDLTNLIVQSIMLSEDVDYSKEITERTPQYVKKEDLHFIRDFYRNENTQLRSKLRELKNLIDILNP